MSLTTNSQERSKRYSIIIEWSDEDNAYIVTLPEFPHCHTHGSTREEALQHGQEVLELVIESDIELGRPLPQPKLFDMDEVGENIPTVRQTEPQTKKRVS
jgi:antitoxin HicB